MLNGRFVGDSLDYHKYVSNKDLRVSCPRTGSLKLSDNVQIELYITYYINWEIERQFDKKNGIA